MTILRVQDVGVRMGSQQILRGVTLEVPERGVVGVIGSNGVGKTSLMRAISGIYRCSGGTIAFEGTPITNLKSHRIVRLGLVQAPEGRMIFGAMTVRENLVLGAVSRPAGDRTSQFDHVLSIFPPLADRLRQKAGSLSGGEQQMLCIGRALMAKPKLLLLDEPSLGLAPKTSDTVFELVRTLRADGMTVVLVEQKARQTLKIADRAYLLETGRVVTSGPAAEMIQSQVVSDVFLGVTTTSQPSVP